MYLDYEDHSDWTQSTPAHQHSHATAGSRDSSWILYTIILVSILVSLIALILIYDICTRYRELKGQFIHDGGPPSSPDHQSSYLVTIQAESISANFDTRRSVIKVDLMDMDNRYLTGFVVPVFKLKFKSDGSDGKQRSDEYPLNDKTEISGPTPPLVDVYENWSNTTPAQSISFHLIRRNPLVKLASIRICHDCYQPDAYLTLKHMIIQDEASKQKAKVNLSGKPIKATTPCPPSKYQVYSAECCNDD